MALPQLPDSQKCLQKAIFIIFKGKIINLDGHFIGYFGKSKIGKDKHPTRNISMKGIRAFFSQDQETGNPIFARVAYPRKGLTPEIVTIPMLENIKDILPEMEKVVFDKWFSVGSLLEYLDKKIKLKYVTLIKLYENRIEEMKSIPKDEFKPLVGTDRLIGFKETNLRNFSGNMKLIVVRFFEDGIEKYYGYLTNDYESSEEQILNEKSWRWRIENFFKNCNFLGIDALPSIEFPALVKANGDRIVVTFFGNYKDSHKEAVQKLMKKFDETGMNVPISWMGDRRIEVRFK